MSRRDRFSAGEPTKYEVVVLGVVEREQTSALDPYFLVEEMKDAIEFVDGEHFADSGVVIENQRI